MKNKKGFTLLEVMLSIVIMALLAPIIINSTSSLLHSQKSSKDYNQAVLLAQDALEISYNRLQTDFSGFPDDGLHLAEGGSIWGAVPASFGRIIDIETLNMTIAGDLTDGAGTPVDAAKRIKTTVSWTENGRDEEVKLEADFVNWDEITP